MFRPALLLALALPLVAQAREKPAPAKAAAPSEARDALARIQKFYDGATDLHARFEQSLETGIGVKRKASGEVWLKKPGRMRWEYERPDKKLMVADGQTLWVYEPEDEQAFRQELRSSALPSSVTFLWGAGKLADEFTASPTHVDGVGATGDLVLKLVPKQATAQYRYLVFVVDPSSMVKETIVYDQQGGSNHMTFRDVELNKGVADGKFVFTPPAGTRVIRP
jgi:outer membrane lipoprotein carrier protein